MNIWSLNKHKHLKLLLLSLQKQLGFKVFSLDFDENDDYMTFMLIKFDQPEVRSYVYLYGQAEGQYGVHLEYPRYVENDFSDAVQIYENLSLQQVVNTMATHFEISNYEMAG